MLRLIEYLKIYRIISKRS